MANCPVQQNYLHFFKVEKNPKRKKELSSGNPREVSTSRLTLSLQKMPFDVFPDYISFSYFLTSSSNFLAFCWAANQYSETNCIFSKILENSAGSKS